MLKMFKNKIVKKLFRNMEEYEIDMVELKRKQKEGAEIVDVRSSQEYEEGHIEGAINIPYYEINNKVYKILKDRDKEIVVYCEAGSRSKKAYKKLISLQYRRVFNLYGGIQNWE